MYWGYNHTMTAFLQECTSLPTNTTMMVLPEAPLGTIIAEYKARTESALLLGKLGAQASWDALWEKLQHYLSQLRTLANALLETHPDHPIPKRPTQRRRQYRTKSNQQQIVSSSLHVPPQHPAPMPAVATPLLSASSPKKKVPIEVSSQQQISVSSNETPQPPASSLLAPQQLLDILLEDESLQNHLADLINSSLLSDGEAGVADSALDSLLAMTMPASSSCSTPNSRTET